MVFRGTRWLGRVAKVLASVLIVAGVGGVPTAAQAADEIFAYTQGFEGAGDSIWFWNNVEGGGSGEWDSDACGQARRGCGSVIMHQPPTGWISLFANFRIGGFPNGGTCSISYWARLWQSTGPAIARLEVINPSTWTYIAVGDLHATSTWQPIVVGFLQGGPRNVLVRITLPGSGSASSPSVGINVDDFKINCGPAINGRG
jgi:hypothetical protein